eukprot:PhM_4_TR19092/c0_g1_i1/m.43927/K14830/MAK11, PAK1IP1; protein MAK11
MKKSILRKPPQQQQQTTPPPPEQKQKTPLKTKKKAQATGASPASDKKQKRSRDVEAEAVQNTILETHRQTKKSPTAKASKQPKATTTVAAEEDPAFVGGDATLLIAVGSYEQILHAWGADMGPKMTQTEDDAEEEIAVDAEDGGLVPLFHVKHHASPIRCVASDSKWLVTSAGDEKLFVYNARKLQVDGDLPLDGEVTSLQLKANFCFGSTTQGRVHVWRTGTWEPVFVVEAHTKACNGFAIHPSMKLGVSVGEDRIVSVLNLVRGQKMLEIKHTEPLLGVAFGTDKSNSYALMKRTRVEVADTLTGAVQKSIEKMVNVVRFLTDDVLLLGTNDGFVQLYCLETWAVLDSKTIADVADDNDDSTPTTAAPKVRCRDLSVLSEVAGQHPDVVATITSCGVLTLWTVDRKKMKLVRRHQATRYGSRFTCVTVTAVQKPTRQQQQH